MNSPYRRKLIVTHIRKLKPVHKLGQYMGVHKFTCVYQLPKGSLYRIMMQVGIKLSTEHPAETNNNFEYSYLKAITLLVKINYFTLFQLG